MPRRSFFVAVATLGLFSSAQLAWAKQPISNSLFSISIPTELVAETDGKATLLASGPKGEEGLPFLIVYFCAHSAAADEITPCNSSWHPLNAGDIRALGVIDWKGSISTRVRDKSVTEWSACASQSKEVVICIHRLRSATGYIDVRYISEAPIDKAAQTVEAIVISIHWR